MKVNPEEEEGIREAVRQINEEIKTYEQSYAVKDKQDLLAMCALQFATQAVRYQGKSLVDEEDVQKRLKIIEELITENL